MKITLIIMSSVMAGFFAASIPGHEPWGPAAAAICVLIGLGVAAN